MLLSVINDVINDYYHPELIKLYRKILIDLDFKLPLFNSKYIFYNYKKFDNLKFDNHNMVLVDENRNFVTNDKIIFNPIDDNEFSCSFLTLEDGIHNKLSFLVNDIFEAVIGTKLNIYRGNISLHQYHTDIHNLPITDKYTLWYRHPLPNKFVQWNTRFHFPWCQYNISLYYCHSDHEP